MFMATLKRQFINDESGNPVAVILPFEEYVMVKDLLDHASDTEKLSLMEKAINDERFMADLQSAMSDFRHVDAEWWESDA
jgi:hypothetical protein